MGRKRRTERVQVTVNGAVVGSLYKRGRAWWFDCRLYGQRRFVAMRTRDLEEAVRRAKAEASRGPKIPDVHTFERREVIQTLGIALERFKEDQQARNRPSSVTRVMDTARRFVLFIGGEERSPRIITRSHLVAFRDHRKAAGISLHTVNSDLQRAKIFVNYLRVENLVEGDPTFKVRRLKVSSIASEAPDSASVEQLVETFGHSWLADFAVVLANSGLRPSEGLHLRACDVDAKKCLLRVRQWGDWSIKDHEARTLAMNDTALAILSRRKLAVDEDESLLFPSPDGKPYEYRNFATREWRKRRGSSTIAPYDLRHYFASQAVSGGWSVERLSRYLGHSSVTVTERYYVDRRALCEVGPPPKTTRLLSSSTARSKSCRE